MPNDKHRLTNELLALLHSSPKQPIDDLDRESFQSILRLYNQQMLHLRQVIRDIQSIPASISNRSHALSTRKSYTQSTTLLPISPQPSMGSSAQPFQFVVPQQYSAVLRTEKAYSKTQPDLQKWEDTVTAVLQRTMKSSLDTFITAMVQDEWNSAKSFDSLLKKAERNFLIRDPRMEQLAEKNVTKQASGSFEKSDPRYSQLIEKEAANQREYLKNEVKKDLQNIALAHAVNTEEIARAYYVSSRRLANPHMSIAVAEASATMNNSEKVGISKAATKLTSLILQQKLSLEQFKDLYIRTSTNHTPSRNQRLQSMWQATSIEAFDVFKNQPGNFTAILTVLLQRLRENTKQTALAVRLLSNASSIFGGKATYSKTREHLLRGIEKRRKERVSRLLEDDSPLLTNLSQLHELSQTYDITSFRLNNLTNDFQNHERQLQRTQEALRHLTDTLSVLPQHLQGLSTISSPSTGLSPAIGTPLGNYTSTSASGSPVVPTDILPALTHGTFDQYPKGSATTDSSKQDLPKSSNMIENLLQAVKDTKFDTTVPDEPDNPNNPLPPWKKKLKRFGRQAAKVAKRVPYVGALMLAYDVSSELLQPMYMTDLERKSRLADNQATLAKEMIASDKLPIGAKHLSFLGLAMNGASDGLIHALGGTTPSWSDYLNAFKDTINYDGPELESHINKSLKIYETKSELEIEKEREKKKKAAEMANYSKFIDLDGDGNSSNNTPITDWSEVKTMEHGKEMISYAQKKLALEQSSLSSSFEKEKSDLLLQGEREDSEAMRELMEKYFAKNISALDEFISLVKEQQNKLVYKDTDANKVVQAAINDAEAAKGKNQQQNSASIVDRAMNRLNADLQNTEVNYSIERSKAILAGHSPTSQTIRNIDEALLSEKNKLLASTESEINSYINNNQMNSDLLDKINTNKSHLEKAQYDNLVAIKMAMQSVKGTFNMPDGIRPLTYWDMLPAQATQGTYDFTYGGANVNITIDKMSGNDADLQMLGATVSEAIRHTQSRLSTELSQQVRSGIATSYNRL
ncbi:hypothetical protein [Brevibacillus reuszeri]|uniref:hypothetical protein n=1 Tax=Brevibacillus reuszeri TaxID=54915 RepID=UPI002899E01E|nr:hypothetical protein [Brevibacillus reuszeri]